MLPEPGPHSAAVADASFLAALRAATDWWADQSTWHVTSSLTGGGVVAAFEEAVARAVGVATRALALPSATSALTAAFTALGLTRGDTIGVPSVDWTASRAVARQLGLRTVPLPVVGDSGLLDVTALRHSPGRIEGVAAIVAVDLHGRPCDVPALRDIPGAVPIVEDAAQAWAARYPSGQPVGSSADLCVFSFGETKIPAAGELGCLVSAKPDLYREAVRLTQHPTRQLLQDVATPQPDSAMTRVAPAAALLGAWAVNEHARQIPELRRRGRLIADALASAGFPVLSDPDLDAPGVVAAVGGADDIWLALAAGSLIANGLVADVDQADLIAHPSVDGRTSVLPDVVVVTAAVPARRDSSVSNG